MNKKKLGLNKLTVANIGMDNILGGFTVYTIEGNTCVYSCFCTEEAAQTNCNPVGHCRPTGIAIPTCNSAACTFLKCPTQDEGECTTDM